MVDLMKELKDWYNKIDEAQVSEARIGQLFTLGQILDALKDMCIVIPEEDEVVLRLGRIEHLKCGHCEGTGQLVREPTVIGMLQYEPCFCCNGTGFKIPMKYIQDQLRQQLEGEVCDQCKKPSSEHCLCDTRPDDTAVGKGEEE